MENEELYPELVDYIYHYRDEFQTLDEKVAGKCTIHREKELDPELKAILISRGWYSGKEHFQPMLANGKKRFIVNVSERIFTEHRAELNLNICTKCNKIARTPWAKQ